MKKRITLYIKYGGQIEIDVDPLTAKSIVDDYQDSEYFVRFNDFVIERDSIYAIHTQNEEIDTDNPLIL